MASPQKIITLCSSFIAVIGILWIFLYHVLKEDEPNLWKPIQTTVFDYIVVGGGTAGSVVATLLSKHSNSTVLLIEAGDKFGYLSKIPLLATFMQRGINDWTFLSVPQKHSSMGLHDRRQALPRGKGLGGSSQMNYMLHFDGYEKDFDRWQAMGLHKWSYTAFKPYLDAARPKPDELLTIGRHYSKLSEALHRAQNDFEHKPWNFRRAQYTIKKGYRLGVYSRYLQTVFGKWNLKIITNALVRRVNINSGVAQSVTIGVKDDSGRETRYDVSANKEIILSCGAYQSPQILLLSGLGSRRISDAVKIPVVKELPQVGQNLFDHMNLPLFVSIAERASLNSNAILSVTEIFEYLSTGKGHFGNFGVIGNIDILDRESGLIMFGVGAVDESVLMSISNFKREHFRALFPLYYNTTQEGFVFISTCYQPISRGSVRIGSDNVRRNPLIDPNYLAKDEDINCTLSAIQIAAKIVTSEAFSILKPKIHWPKVKQCLNFGPFERDFKWNQPSENYLKCLLRHVGLTSHHPGGTCAMGLSEADSVVDQELRVHGVKGLRVIDASVLPTPLTGNPNSIIEAIAIRGASFILRSNEKLSNKNKL